MSTTVLEQLCIWQHLKEMPTNTRERQKTYVRWLIAGGLILDELVAWHEFVSWWQQDDLLFAKIKIPHDLPVNEKLYRLISRYIEQPASVDRIVPPLLPNEATKDESSSSKNNQSSNELMDKKNHAQEILFKFLETSRYETSNPLKVDRWLALKVAPHAHQIVILDELCAIVNNPEKYDCWAKRLVGINEEKTGTVEGNGSETPGAKPAISKNSKPCFHDVAALAEYISIPIPTIKTVLNKNGLPESLLLQINDFVSIPDSAIQALLREVSSDAVIRALLISGTSLKQKFFLNMSDRAAALLTEEITQAEADLKKGVITNEDCKAAIREFEATWRTLNATGKYL